jgi:hypothetical protein
MIVKEIVHNGFDEFASIDDTTGRISNIFASQSHNKSIRNNATVFFSLFLQLLLRIYDDDKNNNRRPSVQAYS